jgi:hypothetical protein
VLRIVHATAPNRLVYRRAPEWPPPWARYRPAKRAAGTPLPTQSADAATRQIAAAFDICICMVIGLITDPFGP